MVTIQPFLPSARDVTDLSFVFSGGDIDFMLGLALIERVACDAATLRYKMTLGRMVNFGVPLDVLRKQFHHDHRTLRNWARGMTSRPHDFVLEGQQVERPSLSRPALIRNGG